MLTNIWEVALDEMGGYPEYEFVSEFYDYVVRHVQRQDLEFYVGLAMESGVPHLHHPAPLANLLGTLWAATVCLSSIYRLE